LEGIYLPCHPAELPALAAVLDTVPDPRSPRPALPAGAPADVVPAHRPRRRHVPGEHHPIYHRLRPSGACPPRASTAIRLAASTVGRLLARLDGDALDHAIGIYLAHLTA